MRSYQELRASSARDVKKRTSLEIEMSTEKLVNGMRCQEKEMSGERVSRNSDCNRRGSHEKEIKRPWCQAVGDQKRLSGEKVGEENSGIQVGGTRQSYQKGCQEKVGTENCFGNQVATGRSYRFLLNYWLSISWLTYNYT